MKRFLSFALSLALLLATLTIPAFAAPPPITGTVIDLSLLSAIPGDPNNEGDGWEYDPTTLTLTIDGQGPFTIQGNVVDPGVSVIDVAVGNQGATITLQNFNLNDANLDCYGDLDLYLSGSSSIFRINVAPGKTLTIDGDAIGSLYISNRLFCDDATLKVNGGDVQSGGIIGGTDANIQINGGDVQSGGIIGGTDANIQINGGDVSTTTGYIGGDGATIEISGGDTVVTVDGGSVVPDILATSLSVSNGATLNFGTGNYNISGDIDFSSDAKISGLPTYEVEVPVLNNIGGGKIRDGSATPTNPVEHQTVEISADLQRGEQFNRWTFKDGWGESPSVPLNEPDSSETYFKLTNVPEMNTLSIAAYVEVLEAHTLTVNGGSATVDGEDAEGKGYTDETITITADTAPTGQVFDKWVVNTGTPTDLDLTTNPASFTMPGEDVTITATYKDAPSGGNSGGDAYERSSSGTVTFSGAPTGSIQVGDSFTVTPSPDDRTGSAGWEYDSSFFSATFNSPATFTALKEGSSTITYTTLDGVKSSFTVTIGAAGASTTPPAPEGTEDGATGDAGDKVNPSTGVHPSPGAAMPSKSKARTIVR